jgi:hypothetical protein
MSRIPMRKLLVPAIAVMALTAAPAAAQIDPEPTPPCPPSEDRATLGPNGTHQEVSAPPTPSRGILSIVGPILEWATGDEGWGYSVRYSYRLDLSGSEEMPSAKRADVTMKLNWDNEGDFDLFAYHDGNFLGGDGIGVIHRPETLTITNLAHCDTLSGAIVNDLAPPAMEMTLDITVSNLEP